MLDTQSVNETSKAFRGQLLTPEEPDYDAARRVWNGMIVSAPPSSPGVRAPQT